MQPEVAGWCQFPQLLNWAAAEDHLCCNTGVDLLRPACHRRGTACAHKPTPAPQHPQLRSAAMAGRWRAASRLLLAAAAPEAAPAAVPLCQTALNAERQLSTHAASTSSSSSAASSASSPKRWRRWWAAAPLLAAAAGAAAASTGAVVAAAEPLAAPHLGPAAAPAPASAAPLPVEPDEGWNLLPLSSRQRVFFKVRLGEQSSGSSSHHEAAP